MVKYISDIILPIIVNELFIFFGYLKSLDATPLVTCK